MPIQINKPVWNIQIIAIIKMISVYRSHVSHKALFNVKAIQILTNLQ